VHGDRQQRGQRNARWLDRQGTRLARNPEKLQAASAASTDSRIASAQSPRYTIAMLRGAAITAKMMRRVSSDTG